MTEGAGKRVALYGGSFNPPHVCHVLVATWVICREAIDELRVVPVYKHAFGKDLASFDQRCHMLELALAHLGPRVVVSRIEAALGGETNYTIDTVRALKSAEPDIGALSFVCGTDVYAERRKWKEWDALDELLDFIVIGREGEPPVFDDDGTPVTPRTTLPDMSSSGIRSALHSGDVPAGWVPRDVKRFIDREQLYRDP